MNNTTTHKKSRAIFFDKEYNQMFNVLSAKYPKLFIKNSPKLLQINIHKDILNDNTFKISSMKLRKFLHRYVRQKKYMALYEEHASRYDLQGNKVAVISIQDIEFFKNKYAQMLQSKQKAQAT